nr:immunoglobulin heavy chain junction region [Macaca mulatta]
CTTGVDYW